MHNPCSDAILWSTLEKIDGSSFFSLVSSNSTQTTHRCRTRSYSPLRHTWVKRNVPARMQTFALSNGSYPAKRWHIQQPIRSTDPEKGLPINKSFRRARTISLLRSIIRAVKFWQRQTQPYSSSLPAEQSSTAVPLRIVEVFLCVA